MVVIDTSSWTHALRKKGDPGIRKRVEELILAAEAAWCDVVRLELWHGARNAGDRKMMRQLEATIPTLPVTDAVWNFACDLGSFSRDQGLTVPATDLIIFACAHVNGARLEHNDQHYDRLSAMLARSSIPDRLTGN